MVSESFRESSRAYSYDFGSSNAEVSAMVCLLGISAFLQFFPTGMNLDNTFLNNRQIFLLRFHELYVYCLQFGIHDRTVIIRHLNTERKNMLRHLWQESPHRLNTRSEVCCCHIDIFLLL